jgi:hypothetical protein
MVRREERPDLDTRSYPTGGQAAVLVFPRSNKPHASSYFAHFLAKPRAMFPSVGLTVHEIFLCAHYFAISSTIGTVN